MNFVDHGRAIRRALVVDPADRGIARVIDDHFEADARRLVAELEGRELVVIDERQAVGDSGQVVVAHAHRTVLGGTCKRYDGCPAGGQVEICTFTGMGHCWASRAITGGIYSCPAYASSTQLAWQFFKTDAW